MRCGPAMFESIELSEEIMESLLMTTNQLGGCDELDDYINEIALKKIRVCFRSYWRNIWIRTNLEFI